MAKDLEFSKDPLDLATFDTVFCDSLTALQWARARGLPSTAVVMSSSPTLLLEEPASRRVEDEVPTSRVRDFFLGLNGLVEGIYRGMREEGESHSLAISAAFGVFSVQPLLHRALCISRRDLYDRRLVLQPMIGIERYDRAIANVWPDLLGANAKAVVVGVPVSPPRHGLSQGGRSPAIVRRLTDIRLNRLRYRINLQLSGMGRRGRTALIFRDGNDLLKDTASELCSKGWRLSKVKEPIGRGAILSEDIAMLIDNLVSKEFLACFGTLYFDQQAVNLVRACQVAAKRELSRAIELENAWNRLFGSVTASLEGQRVILLNGTPSATSGAAVHSSARRAGIPVVGFQHGIRREISEWPMDASILYENNCCDMFLCYSSAAAVSSARSRYAVCEPVPVGLPDEYSYRRWLVRSRCPVLYASTLLYRGGRQISTTWLSDYSRACKEVALIEAVLSRLPHRVLYKPYPSFRYSDEDPAIRAARTCGVDVLLTEVDLRYVVGRHRVIVTSGATSTVGWAALSGLPLIFIDDPENSPLNAEARKGFDEAFFLFDSSRRDFHGSLREFLSKPLATIQAEAAKKEMDRRRVLKEFFGVADESGGRRAAKIVDARYG